MMKTCLFLMLTVMVSVGSFVIAAEVDTDGDGFSDRQEVAWNTDPKDPEQFPAVLDAVQAWWPLDEGSGVAVGDATENGVDGTVVGTATWVADLDGQVLATDGGNNFVQVVDRPALNPSRGFTVLAMVKAAAGTSGLIVGKCQESVTRSRTGDNRGGSFALGLQNGRPVAEVWVGGLYRPLYAPKAVADGKWHAVGMAYDGLELRIYVDGRRWAATHIGGELNNVAAPLVMGKLAGRMAEVGLLDRALDDGEMILVRELGTGVAGEGAKLGAVSRRLPVGLLLAGTRPVGAERRLHAKGRIGETPVSLVQASTNTVAVGEAGR